MLIPVNIHRHAQYRGFQSCRNLVDMAVVFYRILCIFKRKLQVDFHCLIRVAYPEKRRQPFAIPHLLTDLMLDCYNSKLLRLIYRFPVLCLGKFCTKRCLYMLTNSSGVCNSSRMQDKRLTVDKIIDTAAGLLITVNLC